MPSAANDITSLSLDDDSTIAGVERSLWRIANNPGLPVRIKKHFVSRRKGALHDAARLQLLATWARRAQHDYLCYHRANDVASVIEELCDYAPGLAVLRLCDGVKVGDTVVRRRDALMLARDKMVSADMLEWGKIIKGRTVDFTFMSGSRVQYLRPFFSARTASAVKNKEGMYRLLSQLSKFVAKSDAARIPDTFIEGCSIFASELIKNTQEHATRNHSGQPYLEHTEGAILSWIQMPETEYRQDFEGHSRLLDFWKRESVSLDGQAPELRCLQLSFFDTGPGFVSRWTGVEIGDLVLEDERKELLNCLQKNISTKRQTGAGNGLPDVLRALREIGGLMSIRSGRLNVFNVFSPGEDRGLFDFADWASGDLAPATGAVVSLLIPIRR